MVRFCLVSTLLIQQTLNNGKGDVMKRGPIGEYRTAVLGGETIRAFVPSEGTEPL